MTDVDAIVVGAGFSGLYMLHRLRGLGLSAVVLERGSGVGGTWYWNRYPGARCDVESIDYCYSFSRRAARRSGSGPSATPRSRRSCATSSTSPTASTCAATSASRRRSPRRPRRDDEHWTVETDAGDTLTARHLILAVGNLTAVKRPDFAGLEDFEGDWYHTARWPHEGVDLARQARRGHRHRLDRHPGDPADRASRPSTSSSSSARPTTRCRRVNRPLDPRSARRGRRLRRAPPPCAARATRACRIAPPERAALRRDAGRARARRTRRRWRRGGIRAVQRVHRPVHRAPRPTAPPRSSCAPRSARSCDDPAVAELLCPTTTRSARSALCVDTGYFETYNRDERRRSSTPPRADRGDHAARRARPRTARLRARRHRLRDRLRRDDRRAARRSTSAARGGLHAARGVGGGPAHVPRARRSAGLPEPVHRHRARQPVGAEQHGRRPSSSTSTGSPTASRTCASAASTRIEATRRGRGRVGRARQRASPTARSSRGATPGTWAPTSPASRACSCPTSAASAPTGESATRSRRAATRGSCSARAGADDDGAEGMSDLAPATDVVSVVNGLTEQGIETVVLAGADTHGVMRGKRVPIGQLTRLLAHGVALCDVFWVMHVDRVRRSSPGPRVTWATSRRRPTAIRTSSRSRTVHAAGRPVASTGAALVCATGTTRTARRCRSRRAGCSGGSSSAPGRWASSRTARSSSSSTSCARPPDRCYTPPRRPRPALRAVQHVRRRDGVEPGAGRPPHPRGHARLGLPVEACNPETGPGQFEITLRHRPALEAADDAFLFKAAVKELAAQEGLVATFMAKPNTEWAGNSCHIHMSLTDEDGRGVFHDGDDPRGLTRRCAGSSPARSARCPGSPR